MTRRERVHATIDRARLDAIPWQFDLTGAVIDRVKRHYGTEDYREALGDHIGMVGIPEPEGRKPEKPGLVRDPFGALWSRTARDRNVGDWGELVEYPLKEPSLEGYALPDPKVYGDWSHASRMRRERPDLFLVAPAFALFERGWSLCGFENYLGYTAGEPDFIHALNERLVEFSCAITRYFAGMGIDGIRFGDDWGFQDRLMLRPELWRELFKPYYARIYAEARAAGLVVMIHSCGNITDLLPDVIEIGVQVVHPLQPEAMDVAACHREYGRDLTFWGGLGSQSTLPKGTPEDVRREVRDRLDLFRDGGYILAPAGAAPAETPAGNIAAIADEARSQLGAARTAGRP